MLKSTSFARLLVLLLAGAGTLASCSKDSAPAPAATPETGVTTSMWTAFVQRVSEGVNSDPLGQYVAKSVQIPNEGTRPVRPKMNAEDRSWASIQSLLAATRGPDVPYIQPIEPTCDDYSYCGGGGGGGGTPTVYSTFTSSEGIGMDGDPTDNPTNAIMCVTALIRDSERDANLTMSASASVYSGFNRLNADLNKGAGGKYIYLTFTRKSLYPGGYWFNLYQGDDSGRKRPITRFRNPGEGGTIDGNYTNTWWEDVSKLLGGGIFNRADFNDGAGGPYIYLQYSKLVETQRGFPYPTQFVKEVGVLSGNSSSIQPPAGWIKHPQDLNQGVGGDYIYLCYKY
ncbi:hypothetical protein LGH70_12930 [Hymenobacter sp. BT635]|uniref:MABP domain-containing protein n=1 Tax=Hymenobacter nitidus TaxID=2880929 RepID=A0ABS8ADP4_9BACT|nr:hypothetical protein [Hymenobacter nitidus]MCB2378497.1 hypothetical protein [Hymenobacter nitidus]